MLNRRRLWRRRWRRRRISVDWRLPDDRPEDHPSEIGVKPTVIWPITAIESRAVIVGIASVASVAPVAPVAPVAAVIAVASTAMPSASPAAMAPAMPASAVPATVTASAMRPCDRSAGCGEQRARQNEGPSKGDTAGHGAPAFLRAPALRALYRRGAGTEVSGDTLTNSSRTAHDSHRFRGQLSWHRYGGRQ